MRKLSEIKGEESIDILADLIEAGSVIIDDGDVAKAYKENKAKALAIALKKYKKEVIRCLAVLDGKSEKEFAKGLNLLTLPKMVMEVMNDPDISDLFTSQVQEETTSGPAMESTEEREN